jgi:hypothetical protein
MNFFSKSALLASAFALLPVATSVPAEARAAVVLDFGSIGVGYRDGYLDQNRQYHRWANQRDAVTYRTRYRQNYRDMNHDRDRDRSSNH